jgi:hypothetical protein
VQTGADKKAAAPGAREGSGPALLDAYEVDESHILGRGTFASVKACTRRADGALRAVKLVNVGQAATDEQTRRILRAALVRECHALESLDHPRVPRLEAWGWLGPETFYVVMPLVPDGRTLRTLLRAWGSRMPLSPVVALARQIADALHHTHGRGYVHRDIKPTNVGVGPDGGVIILDFGLVKAIGDDAAEPPSNLTVAGWGSYRYGAPEQFFGGAVGPWTDVYGLGAVLFEMLAGHPSITARGPLQVARALRGPMPTLPPDPLRPRLLETLVYAMLAREPEARMQSMGPVLEQLDAAQAALTAHGPAQDAGLLWAGAVQSEAANGDGEAGGAESDGGDPFASIDASLEASADALWASVTPVDPSEGADGPNRSTHGKLLAFEPPTDRLASPVERVPAPAVRRPPGPAEPPDDAERRAAAFRARRSRATGPMRLSDIREVAEAVPEPSGPAIAARPAEQPPGLFDADAAAAPTAPATDIPQPPAIRRAHRARAIWMSLAVVGTLLGLAFGYGAGVEDTHAAPDEAKVSAPAEN